MSEAAKDKQEMTAREPVAEAQDEPRGRDGAEIPALAREAVEAYVRRRQIIDAPTPPPGSLLREEAACFVSIKTDGGQLRGCIGTIEPTRPTLAEELIHNSIGAATRDPRFPPVTVGELQHLRYSVDVLERPVPASLEELDPAQYGLIVEDKTGALRGLLLPDIQGVETVTQQVEIAARKAGIAPDTPLNFYRFRVRRFRETGRLN